MRTWRVPEHAAQSRVDGEVVVAKEHAQPKSVNSALICVCVYFLLLASPGICWTIQQPGLESLLQGLIIPIALLAAYASVWGKRLWLGLVLFAPFVVLAPAEFAFIASYWRPSDYDIIATLFDSNAREIREFLGSSLWPMVAAFSLALGVAFAAPILAYRSRLGWTGEGRIRYLVIATLVPLAIFCFAFVTSSGPIGQRLSAAETGFSDYAQDLRSGFPFGVPIRAQAFYESWRAMRVQAETLRDFRFGARSIADQGKRQIYVFVVGESSRRDHWQLFGYSRATTPQLSEIANLIPLPDMISTWSFSRLAIPVLLTRKPGTDPKGYFSEASILRAFSEAGFRTYWLSNQVALGEHDSPVSISAFEADTVRFFNPSSWVGPSSYDEVLLPALTDVVGQSSGNLFIVLHTMGSHEKYVYRYPPTFDHFLPSVASAGDTPYKEKSLNSYDNSILYTDDFLARVIAILQANDAITGMFYSSDHGEDIPNAVCSFGGHGHPSLPDFTIPALFWYSDAYAKAFPEHVDVLRRNSKARITTENVFESLIDFGGLTFASHDPSKSLLSDTFKERPRLVNAFGVLDFDHANIGKNCPILF
jgi:glucan phosphoethanolaminetransferase (alkaline phosphatase superfamily)